MRSRPKIELTYWPAEPRPGDTVHFEATLISRSETPVDAVYFRFRGLEEQSNESSRRMQKSFSLVADGRSYLMTRPQPRAGTSTLFPRDEHCHVDQSLEMGRMVLSAGERRVLPFALVLPAGLPPSWRSRRSKVEYLLDLRVDIPWWPDRTARYELPVRATPRQPERRPLRVSDAPAGPRGTELSLELGLENAAVELGGVVRGALAVINAEHHRLLRLEVAVVIDEAPAGDTRDTQEVYRSPPEVICVGTPVAGYAYPFEVRLPGGLPPSFHGALVAVSWHLEARAVVRLGRALVAGAELDVYAAAGQRDETPVGTPRVAPLGSARRTLVWSEVAKRTGLVHDAAQESLTGRAGPVAFEVALELRGDQLHQVASLEWPELGLDLSLTERRWSDALQRDLLVSMEDPAFDARFTVRARDAAQARGLLSPELRAVLFDFERVALDDGEAQVASPGNGSTAGALEHFTRAVMSAASLLDQAIPRVPAPAGLASTTAAWRAEAEKRGGTFRVGDFSIRSANLRGAPVELITRFDNAGGPEATVARVLLASPPRVDPLPPEVQRLVTSLSAECAGLRICADAVEATLPTPLAEPARAESLWRALLRLAQALSSG